MEEILPAYLAIGVSYERFMGSNPHELKPYELANIKRMKLRDQDMYLMSRYVYEAVACAVDNVMRGKDSNLTFRTKSYSEEAEEIKAQEDIEQQKQILINGLNAMKMRFEIAQMQKTGR